MDNYFYVISNKAFTDYIQNGEADFYWLFNREANL